MRGEEIYHHWFLNLTLDGREWLAFRKVALPPVRAIGVNWIGHCMQSKFGFDVSEKISPSPVRNRRNIRLTSQYAINYTNWAIPATIFLFILGKESCVLNSAMTGKRILDEHPVVHVVRIGVSINRVSIFYTFLYPFESFLFTTAYRVKNM